MLEYEKSKMELLHSMYFVPLTNLPRSMLGRVHHKKLQPTTEGTHK